MTFWHLCLQMHKKAACSQSAQYMEEDRAYRISYGDACHHVRIYRRTVRRLRFRFRAVSSAYADTGDVL